ncbi:MAG: DNA repair protein RecO [Deltaproteobacteria bacterium]
MEELHTEAFVLRTRPFSESDVITVLLTRERGKISGIAKGARRSRRRFAGGALEPFQEIRVRLSQRPQRSLAFVHESRVTQSHRRVAEDLKVYAWACYLLELTDAVTPENDPCPDLYDLFKHTMAGLADGAGTVGPEPLAHHFILGLLEEAGWAPNLASCTTCGQAITEQTRPLLHPDGHGLVCSGHEAERQGLVADDPSFRPSRRIIFPELLTYLCEAAVKVPAQPTTEVGQAATLLLERLVDLHLAKPLKARTFLAEMNQAESA